MKMVVILNRMKAQTSQVLEQNDYSIFLVFSTEFNSTYTILTLPNRYNKLNF
jgi:hypothetical protein